MVVDGLFYTRQHEWAKIEGDMATVGITDYAQQMLGEYCLGAVPFVQAMIIMDDRMNLSESFRFIPIYMLLGFFFAWRAKCRLRRNIF